MNPNLPVKPDPFTYSNIKQYDYFQTPSGPSTSSHLASPSYPQGLKGACPNCLKGISFFSLPNDKSNTIFCNSCKQPTHKCPVHQISISGMGYHVNDPKSQQCQCNIGQSFLGDARWDSCFN